MNLPSSYALIPIKRFERGKTRLQSRLSAAARSELARGMFEHVLETCLGCDQLAGTLVATDAAEIASWARARGALALEDPPPSELERACASSARLAVVIDAALGALRVRAAGAALVLMADLPRIVPADLDELLRALTECDLVLAPDARGTCTNALGLRLGPGAQFRSAFGSTSSLALHQQRARALGLRVRVQANPRLAEDIDLPSDLDALAGSREDG